MIKRINSQVEEVSPPSPTIDEELGIEKEAFDKEVSVLLAGFGLSPDTRTEINYKSLKKWVISRLVCLIRLSDYKVHTYCRPKLDKLQWARLMGYNLQILNSVLKDEDIQDIKKRMEQLENVRKNRR